MVECPWPLHWQWGKAWALKITFHGSKDFSRLRQQSRRIYTEKIVAENKDYYTVVEIGAGEKLWNAGYLVGNRVYKNPIDLTKI